MRNWFWTSWMIVLLSFLIVTTIHAAPFSADEKQSHLHSAEKQHLVHLLNAPERLVSLDELDESTQVYSTTFDWYEDWTIVDYAEDGATWHNSAVQSDGPDFNDYGDMEGPNAPFMWVDSGLESDMNPMIESLISPSISIEEYDFTHLYLLFDTTYDDNRGISPDSARVDYSVDGGDSWHLAASWNEVPLGGFPCVVELTEHLIDESSFVLKFTYEDGGMLGRFWTLDNVRVIGSDQEAEFTPPEIELLDGPAFCREADELVISAWAIDNVELDYVELGYAHYSNGRLSDITYVDMLPGENPDEFVSTIPGTFATPNDTIVYAVSAVDLSGNMDRDPENFLDWNRCIVYPAGLDYEMTQLEWYSWIDITTTGSNLELSDASHAVVNLTELGLPDFYWYGVPYSQVVVNADGYIQFGERTGFPGQFTGTLPSPDDPNGIVAALATDLYPDAEGSGNVWVGAVDGMLVISWEDVYFYDLPAVEFGPDMQIILDPFYEEVIINYREVDGYTNVGGSDYTRNHLIGFENGDGFLGGILYQGEDFGFPESQTSWRIGQRLPAGGLTGTVYELDQTTIIAGADINVYSTGPITDLVATATTNELGIYEIEDIPAGSYDLEIIAAGYLSQTINRVSIEDLTVTTQDVYLEAEVIETTIEGNVLEAGSDIPIANVTVELVDLELSTTTDETGHFSFGDQLLGTYHFAVSLDPAGSNGYHDAQYTGVVIGEEAPPLAFTLDTILPPQNLRGRGIEEGITLYWSPPANHETLPQLQRIRDDLKQDLEKLTRRGHAHPSELRTIQAKLAHVENRLQESDTNSLDKISDFVGYRIRINTDMVHVPANEPDDMVWTIDELEDGVEYTCEVAADYGYGVDYLVFSEPLTVIAGTAAAAFSEVEYNWLDITTTGTRLEWEDSDGLSAPIALGQVWHHYDSDATVLRIAANGVVVFGTEATTVPAQVGMVPSDTDPNFILAPFWTDLNPRSTMSNGIYYQLDEVQNQFVVTWDCQVPETRNVFAFQLILELDEEQSAQRAIFQYHSASDGWVPGESGALIGVENATGTVGTVYPYSAIENETAIQLRFVDEAGLTTITGVLRECSETGLTISGAEVFLNGEEVATSGDDGSFTFTAPAGIASLRFEHERYWPLVMDEVTIPFTETADLGDLIMTRPSPVASQTTIEIPVAFNTDEPTVRTFEISNSGCGVYDYISTISLQNRAHTSGHDVSPSDDTKQAEVGPRVPHTLDELDFTWDHLVEDINVETATQNNDLFGVVMVDREVYVNHFDPEMPNRIWVIDLAGDLVLALEPVSDANWSNDLTYNPATRRIMTIGDDGHLYSCLLTGASVINHGDVGRSAQGIAYDYDNQLVYWNDSDNGQWGTYDMTTGDVTELDYPAFAPMLGLAYMPRDPDGYTIYAACRPAGGSAIYRYSPERDVWAPGSQLLFDDDEVVDITGLNVTDSFRPGYFDIVTLAEGYDGSHDRVDVWEGFRDQSWMSMSPSSGSIESNNTVTFTITIDPSADPAFNPTEGQYIPAQIILTGEKTENIVISLEMYFSDTDEAISGLPGSFALHQNYPNPFNPTTTIKYDLVTAQTVRLAVYNLLGQEVALLVDKRMDAGYHQVQFDGRRLASGVYFISLDTPDFQGMKKMILMK